MYVSTWSLSQIIAVRSKKKILHFIHAEAGRFYFNRVILYMNTRKCSCYVFAKENMSLMNICNGKWDDIYFIFFFSFRKDGSEIAPACMARIWNQFLIISFLCTISLYRLYCCLFFHLICFSFPLLSLSFSLSLSLCPPTTSLSLSLSLSPLLPILFF